MSQIQTKINKAKTMEKLRKTIDQAEPRQENGHLTQFNSHLRDAYWMEPHNLEAAKVAAIKICKFYNK